MHPRVVFCALAVALFTASIADAQLATAAVAIQVRGPAAAGVSIRLLPVGVVDRTWSGETDAHGRIAFPRIDPGTYRLALPAADKAVTERQFEVGAGDVLAIEVDPAAASLRIVRRDRTGYRTDFSRADLAVLPSSDDVWSFIETVAPAALVDRMDTGGISTGQPGLLGTHASSWTQASFFDDSVNVTSALAGGTPLLYPDGNALGGLSIVTADTPIDVSTPGPVTVLIPAAPSSLWRWSADASFSPRGSRARATTGPPSVGTLNSWTHGAFVAGGALGPRTGMTVALASTRSMHTERDRPPQLPGDVDSITGGLVVTSSNTQKIDVHASLQRTVHPFAGRALLQDRSATAHDRFSAIRAGWQGGSTSPRWIDIALESSRTEVDAPSAANGTIERLRDAPVPQLALSNPGARGRWTVHAGMAPDLGNFDRGRHAMTFGAELSRSSASTSLVGVGPIGEKVDGLPARAWVYTDGTMTPRAITAAIYGDDRYTPIDRVSIDLGLRLETVGASGGAGSQHARFTDGIGRLSLRWSPSNNLSLFASCRRYDDQLPLVDFLFGDPSAPQASVYRWQDPNGDGIVQPGELGTLIARAGPGSAGGLSAIDPNLARPHTNEALVGFDVALAGWSLRVAGVATHERGLVALTDPGVSGYTVTYVPDPGLDLGSPVDDQQLPIYARPPATFGRDRYLLTNPPGLNGAFNGVEMTITGQAGPVRMLFGAAAMHSHGPAANRGFLPTENDQGLPGELLTNPNATTYADGRLYFDPGYSIKWSGVYTGPHGIRAAVAARYQDGQNFARLVIAPNLPQGPEAIRAYRNGLSKFTFRLTTDAHLEKGFAIGRDRLAAILEVYNLLNTANEVEENVVTGGAFRTPTAVQPPRVVRIGLRFEY